MPQVSIIVPVYKIPENYLRKCIESIIAQTLKDIEILLIDDGSPDNCGKICDDYAAKDKRIKVIHKENGGLSSARNCGYRNASGNYIMFVDGDDWIDNKMCKSMLKSAEENDVQLVMCGMCKEYNNSRSFYKYYIEPDRIYRDNECKWLQEQVLQFNANISTVSCKLIKKDYLIKNNILHDELLRQGAEGFEFNLRLFENLKSAIFLDKYYYHYVYNFDSISSSHNEENHEYVIKCFEKINTFIKKSNNEESLKKWFDNRLLYVIITTAISGYFNPSNKEPYFDKKKKYKKYLEKNIVKKALCTDNLEGISMTRKIILFFIKHKMFFMLDFLGKIRKLQKTHK